MLAIAGITAWLGYLVMTYGLSQVGGQNYSIGQLAIPGRFTLGNPAPDPPGTTSTVPGSGISNIGNAAPGPAKGGYVKPDPKTGKCPKGWFLAGDGYCGQRVGV